MTGIKGPICIKLENISKLKKIHCLRIEFLNKLKINHPNKRNNIGMQAAIYCSKGMEWSEAVNKIKIIEIIKREIDRLKFFKGQSSKNGININGKR